jgi:hypothetical protein
MRGVFREVHCFYLEKQVFTALCFQRLCRKLLFSLRQFKKAKQSFVVAVLDTTRAHARGLFDD